ncbi:MAG: hypothetical protein PHR28_12040 [candidate division Zixibacteria bacterium]|nr:hypothetical protein [candidate division Zixibacteria bacterium]
MNHSLPFHEKSAASSRRPRFAKGIWIFALAVLAVLAMGRIGSADTGFIDETQIRAVVDEYTAANKDVPRDRFERGVRQASEFWRENDGSTADFARFCKDNFIADSALLQQTADRLEAAFESINGYSAQMGRDLTWNLDVDTGPLLPVDYMLAQYSPYAHIDDDLFQTKIAFLVLLNYPKYTLDERLRLGPAWTSNQWMQARLAGQFDSRIPSDVALTESQAIVSAGDYVSNYNIFMHHLLTPDGKRPFPKGLRLLSHWNLRDELKSLYPERNGLARQKMIYALMGKILRQEIPAAVINNPAVDWTMSTNKVVISPEVDGPVRPDGKVTGAPGTPVDNAPEPLARFAHILDVFHAEQGIDKYCPTLPTVINRRFDRDREIPEDTIRQMFVTVLTSDAAAKTGKLIKKRLGRSLQPFDIWYDGFKVRSTISEDKLDSMVRAKYPSVQAFQADLGHILGELGFDAATADYLASKISVDAARGSGHAAEPGRRDDKAHLRTRLGANGMDYKGFSIAVHEFGHNVEQVFSLYRVEHTLLRGVPNSAFTEAFAFVFQEQDLRLLGFTDEVPNAQYLKDLDVFWQMYEISGVALIDMSMWHWLYDHPEATPAQLKDAVIAIAKEIWNTYYAPVFGVKDIDLLAIYSHMIDYPLYLPDYPLGQVIAFQMERYLQGKNLGKEMERMCVQGSISPGLWMERAVGAPISTKPMIDAANEALKALSK